MSALEVKAILTQKELCAAVVEWVVKNRPGALKGGIRVLISVDQTPDGFQCRVLEQGEP